MISIDGKRGISARARTIYERVDPGRRQQIDSEALAALASWARAFAPGNPEALTARLAWDDLSPGLVAAALHALPPEEPAEWTTWIERIAAAAQRSTQNPQNSQNHSLEFGSASSASNVPYAEIWTAILDAAGRSGIASLDRQLVRELAALGELAVHEAFTQSGPSYAAFVRSMLDDGLLPLWNAYPVLARQVAIAASGWAASTRELPERFDADRARIGEAFTRGADPGTIVDVQPGLSDAHDGRRRVAIVALASGLRVVYKPRDLEIERAFGAIAAWLASRGFDPPLPVSRVLARPGYGWVEVAANEPFAHVEDVRRYFRQAGALLFLTHLLGSRDLHMENLVATREGPVIIDLELLLQPELRPASESDADRSCLRTGLLSLVEFGPGDEVFDVGGLRGSGRVPLAAARRTWRNPGTDAIAYTDETVAQADVKNGVVLDGRRHAPDAYRDEILDGFTRAYEFVAASRAAFPVDAFRAALVRVIARPTNQYALLTTVQSAPRYQKDGAVSSMLADVLIRPLAGTVERQREWPLVVEERRNIEALDVPRFVVPAEGRDLMSAGRVVLEGYFARSPLDSVRERIAALSDEDCRQQRRALERALADSIDSRFSVPLPQSPGGRVAAAGKDEDLGAAAEWIGREMIARATKHGESLAWSPDDPGRAASHYLYGWSLGPAVFLSALAATTGSPAWRDAARAAASPALAWAETGTIDRDQAIGGSSGLGSIVYGLTLCATLTGDERALSAATRVAGLIDANRIARDLSYDVVDGAAGALLALQGVVRVTGDSKALEAAKACGDHLIGAHVDHANGWTWPAASPGDGRKLIGFAHGAAGIGAALARLADATGTDAYRRAAERAFAFVARNFSESDANWPVAEADANDISTTIIRMSAWCHGAPGIAIASAIAGPSSAIARQAAIALDRIPEWAPNQTDHVCCGHMGRVDALLTAGPALGSAEAVPRARTIAARVLARARRKQHFRLSAPGFEYRVFDPGFFKGLSGIGYGLLRLAHPDRIPSVIAFDVRVTS